jgi:N-acetylglucosamine-6-phosphate deacetylase
VKIIDVHTHGIGGYDTLTTSEDHILQIAYIHGNCGVSEIVPTVYPSSIESMRDNMLAIKKAMETQGSGLRDLGPSAVNQKTEAKIMGIHLEGPFLNPAKCGALYADNLLSPSEYTLNKIIDGFEDIIKIITIAPELEGAIDLIKKLSERGIIASMGHSDAAYSDAETGFNAGARGITHIFNAMRGIHHREPGIAGFGLMNQDIYIEVIADPFHLDRKIIELIFSVKDPERIIIISDSVKASNTAYASSGIRDQDGRLLGGSMTIAEAAGRLIDMGLDRDLVLKAISENPHRYLRTGYIF